MLSSLNTFLNNYPFTAFNFGIKVDQSLIYEIYKKSQFFSQPLVDFVISNQKYNIKFSSIQENTISIEFYTGKNFLFDIDEILKKPFKVTFESIDELKVKELFIFMDISYDRLYYFLSNNSDIYSYIEDKKQKTLKIMKKIIEIPKFALDCALNSNKNFDIISKLKSGIITINPISLSLNFYSIFNDVQKNEEFLFILTDERINFFKKLYNFIISDDKKFYYITGSDGIGKSLSLLYYSSLNVNRFIYFNIKLYSKIVDKKEFNEIFYKDLYKYFLYRYKETNKNIINSEYSKTIKYFENEIKKKYEEKNVNEKIYDYIYEFIKLFGGYSYTIIIDQYKNDKVDQDFKGLNKIINLILNNNALKLKIIISTSINNTSNKLALLRNLTNIYLDLKKYDLSKLIYKENFDNINLYNNTNIMPKEKIYTEKDDKLLNKPECQFCENILNQEKENRKNRVLNENFQNDFKIDSNCLLDQYSYLTIKDYYFSLVDGELIYKNILTEQELILAENFNYSLKYIIKYLNLKYTTSKEYNEDDETFQDRIISLFYEKEAKKMENKIHCFYEKLYRNNFKNNEYNDYYILEFQALCKLRSYIFYDKKFNIYNLADELLIFPMKYLHININNYDQSFFPLKQIKNNISFKLEYNNNFVRVQINRIIENIYKGIINVSINVFKGSAKGTFFEMKIDEIFRSKSRNILGISNLECRYLFSLVSNTNNSPVTIKKHRKNEARLLFFGKKEYNILIDDIDTDKFDNAHFNLDKNCYYFSQVSLTGKAFDMCIIIREKDNNFKLFLFQASKKKEEELGSKAYYLSQGDNVANNLEMLYNIKITTKYLIFFVPKINDSQEFIKKLDKNKFEYIYIDIFSNQFYDKNNQELHSLGNQESILDSHSILNLEDYEIIKKNNLIWENSLKDFINQNKNGRKSFYEIYINKFYSSNSYNQIKLILPDTFQKLLLKKVIKENNSILKFIGNCELNNLEEIKNIFKLIILFKKDKKNYIIYDEAIYLIKNNKGQYELKKVENDNIIDNSLELEEEKYYQTKYQIIELQDLLKNNLLNRICFCYLIVNEESLRQFYNFWC